MFHAVHHDTWKEKLGVICKPQPQSRIQPQTLPRLGVGLGLRRAIFRETLANRDRIDWVEIVPENYMGKGGRSLQMLEETIDAGLPIISHGVNLSIGSVDPLNATYLADLKALFDIVQPAWFSDHLCYTSVGGLYLNDLIPLPFTREAVEHVVKRIREVQSQFDIPFLIENVSYYANFQPGEMTEAQFLSEVLEQADCGLMLDVNNIYVNAQNHNYDPVAFLDQIPLERTVQLHVAGHLRRKHLIIDTHGADVCSEVYDLLEEVLRRVPRVNGILLERDNDIPPIDELLAELDEIRRIADEVLEQGQSTVVESGV
jgi:uncharacterized protein